MTGLGIACINEASAHAWIGHEEVYTSTNILGTRCATIQVARFGHFFFTGNDPACGSGHEAFKKSRVDSGRVRCCSGRSS